MTEAKKDTKKGVQVSAEETTPPWERQPGETKKSWEAFAIYRDMLSDRTLRKTAQQLNKNLTTIADWSKKFEWVSRVEKYDSYLDKETRKKREKEIVDMKDRHAKLATAMLAKAAKALQAIPDDEIKPQDVARMIEVGSKLERLSRGETTENVDVKAEHTGKDGGPIETTATVTIFKLPDNGRDSSD
jgi:hypothetical protein